MATRGDVRAGERDRRAGDVREPRVFRRLSQRGAAAEPEQAQRDYFARTTYQRNDKGSDAPFVHTDWGPCKGCQGFRVSGFDHLIT